MDQEEVEIYQRYCELCEKADSVGLTEEENDECVELYYALYGDDL